MSPENISTERHAAFWSKVDQSGGPDACWPWIAGCNEWGYGCLGIRLPAPLRQVIHLLAHRVAWAISNNAEIPEGLGVLHSCDNPPCCNPRHLRPGTDAMNGADKAERNRGRKQWKTHCPRGHEYNDANTYHQSGRFRHCRICDRDRHRERKGLP
jgi:hypothetical protein